MTSPIAAIKLSAHALRASNTLSAQSLADVHRIEEAAEMVARLVESFEPPTTKPGGRLTPPAAHDPVDLYIICCDLAQIRRRTEGAIIHCRAFGDPRVGGDRRRITRVLADILDHAVTRVERGAPMTIAVTGMARHVRVDVHGFGGPAKRKGGGDGLSQIGDLLAGTMVAATVSPNGGSIFTLRLPR